jgi:hypothetical protein
VVDLSALEASTHYDDGYTKHSKPVQWFWEVSRVGMGGVGIGGHDQGVMKVS